MTMDRDQVEASSNERQNAAGMTALDVEKFARALRMVCSAISDFHGADCVLYSLVGSAGLQAIGVQANPVAGSAAWRVGPGDGDMISHAVEAVHQMFVPAGAIQAGMFHAWIEIDDGDKGILFDPTTFQIPMKAKSLDDLDGGRTTVKFAPEYLWIPKGDGDRIDFDQVAQHPDEGVFSYLRKAPVEKVVFAPERQASYRGYGVAVLKCYQSLLAGQEIAVVGLDGENSRSISPREQVYKPLKF